MLGFAPISRLAIHPRDLFRPCRSVALALLLRAAYFFSPSRQPFLPMRPGRAAAAPARAASPSEVRAAVLIQANARGMIARRRAGEIASDR